MSSGRKQKQFEKKEMKAYRVQVVLTVQPFLKIMLKNFPVFRMRK